MSTSLYDQLRSAGMLVEVAEELGFRGAGYSPSWHLRLMGIQPLAGGWTIRDAAIAYIDYLRVYYGA